MKLLAKKSSRQFPKVFWTDMVDEQSELALSSIPLLKCSHSVLCHSVIDDRS